MSKGLNFGNKNEKFFLFLKRVFMNDKFDLHIYMQVKNFYSVSRLPGSEIPFIFLYKETAKESVIPEIKSIIIRRRS